MEAPKGQKLGGLKMSAGMLYPVGDRWKAEQERTCGHTVMSESDTKNMVIENMAAILDMLATTATENSLAQHEAKNLAAEWRKRAE